MNDLRRMANSFLNLAETRLTEQKYECRINKYVYTVFIENNEEAYPYAWAHRKWARMIFLENKAVLERGPGREFFDDVVFEYCDPYDFDLNIIFNLIDEWLRRR
jgi:hypothetical protein